MKPNVVFKGEGTPLIKNLQRIPGRVVRFSKNSRISNDANVKASTGNCLQ